MHTIVITVEKAKDGVFWGRITYDNDLIVDQAPTIEKLKRQFAKLLKAFHDLDPKQLQFEIVYDLTTLFEFRDFLNITAIARRAGINPTLMKHYAAGVKFPSEKRAKEIEKVIHELGQELISTKLGVFGGRSSRRLRQSA